MTKGPPRSASVPGAPDRADGFALDDVATHTRGVLELRKSSQRCDDGGCHARRSCRRPRGVAHPSAHPPTVGERRVTDDRATPDGVGSTSGKLLHDVGHTRRARRARAGLVAVLVGLGTYATGRLIEVS